MRYQTTPAFHADLARLSDGERRAFRAAVASFAEACDQYIARPDLGWPASLRVKAVRGAPGIFEMTWSFSGPDGRATFEWVSVPVDGETQAAVRWRRVGGHRIFGAP